MYRNTCGLCVCVCVILLKCRVYVCLILNKCNVLKVFPFARKEKWKQKLSSSS